MTSITIELTPDEEKILEFRIYHFQGLQIAINQFLSTNEFNYNQSHYDRLVDTYVEKHKLLSEQVFKLLEVRGYHDIPVKLFDYEYFKGILKLHFQ